VPARRYPLFWNTEQGMRTLAEDSAEFAVDWAETAVDWAVLAVL
jgi:hypothetical protein